MAPLQKPHDEESHDDDDTNVGSDGNEEDLDVPRIAQWIDDDDLEPQEHTDDASESDSHMDSDSEEHASGDDGASEAPSRKLRSLQHDLSALPLGALRSAQRSLARAYTPSDSESDSEADSEGDSSVSHDDPSPRLASVKDGGSSDQRSELKRSPTKRSNKHAPVEVTSKRPVGRHRVVIDDKLPKPRDPRFMHATGRYDLSKCKQRYEFLSNIRKDELVTLRQHLKRARKLVANSPTHLRADREGEVRRLERAMKRAESAVNLDNRERVELDALKSAKHTEKEKIKQGKAGWWMKRSEKKELLAKAHLDAIASVGGRQAVKKALEKKRKKTSQKVKKMRPFSRSQGIRGPDAKKRRPVGSIESGRAKRRKV